MKVGALDHPKTKGLKARLQVSRAAVIGHLELLWAFTAQHAAQGDIGKWGDEEIAEACDWQEAGARGPTFFITALIDKGFLDKSEPHRLLVHDWHEHAPKWVHAALAKKRLKFITEASIEPSLELPLEGSVDASTNGSSSPSQAKGSQDNKIAPDGAGQGDGKGERARDLLWESLLQACGIPLTAAIPKSARGAYNKAHQDLRSIKATPESIHAHAQAFKRKWPKVSLTPTALVRRWNECVVPA